MTTIRVLSYPRDKNIIAIKLTRMFSGLGLIQAKQLHDRGTPYTFPLLPAYTPEEVSQNFAVCGIQFDILNGSDEPVLGVVQKLQVAICTLEGLRDGMHCSAPFANGNNDVCGADFTCAACLKRHVLDNTIQKLKG